MKSVEIVFKFVQIVGIVFKQIGGIVYHTDSMYQFVYTNVQHLPDRQTIKNGLKDLKLMTPM